jgi:ureidoacrylate peracid hydrolase
MHNSFIPLSVLERVSAMRGGLKPTVLDPARTAHVVVDLQVGFMEPGGLVEVPIARDIVPQVNALARALRAAGGINAFIRFTADPDEAQWWGPMYDPMPEDYRRMFFREFGVGGHAHALWSELDVAPDDLIVDKTRFSAFIPGTCELDAKLKARGIDTLIVTGTVTNCCCESTVRDAMQMGYKVLFVQDGNASFDDDAHNATLANLAGLFFAEVVTAEEAIARLGGDAGERVAA